MSAHWHTKRETGSSRVLCKTRLVKQNQMSQTLTNETEEDTRTAKPSRFRRSSAPSSLAAVLVVFSWGRGEGREWSLPTSELHVYQCGLYATEAYDAWKQNAVSKTRQKGLNRFFSFQQPPGLGSELPCRSGYRRYFTEHAKRYLRVPQRFSQSLHRRESILV